MKRKITQNGLFLFHADEQPRKEVSAINSFMSWIGGKKALRDEILLRFPLSFERYIEVFGGGGWVLFHKPPGREMEVYNDFNPNLVNLYRCVREHPEELICELTFVLNSRLDFDYVREMLHTKTNLPDVKRAAYFYQLIRQSYASGLDSFGAQPCSMMSNFPLILAACERLQRVVVENKDFEKLIKQYDRPEAFFYENGAFVKKEYGISIHSAKPVLVPDPDSPSREKSGGYWTMKSGYGFTISYNPSIRSLDGYLFPISDAYTSVQGATAAFPEFGYSFISGKCRNLIKNGNKWVFMPNVHAQDQERLHFTPLWFPNGSYTVSALGYDVWTPAGMISHRINSKPLTIEGSAYDDWYLGK